MRQWRALGAENRCGVRGVSGWRVGRRLLRRDVRVIYERVQLIGLCWALKLRDGEQRHAWFPDRRRHCITDRHCSSLPVVVLEEEGPGCKLQLATYCALHRFCAGSISDDDAMELRGI